MLLLVDEADRLSIELLDELRLITNVVREGRSQVQLVLAGTQRLEESLNDPRLASFNQRVASRNFLQNLSRAEVAEYISEHIARVGGNSESVFDDCAIAEIARCTDGCPRLINQVCEIALTEAADDSLLSIDQQVVQQAWAKLQNLPVPSRSQNSPDSSGQGCDSDSESVVEFGSLSDDQHFDSSHSVGCHAGEEVCDSLTSKDVEEQNDLTSYDAVSQSSDFQGTDSDQAGEEDQSDAEAVEDKTDEESSQIEPVVDDVAANEPEMEHGPSSGWSGRLPTNLGVTDFRKDFDDQSTHYSMPTMGSGGDPFAPESSDANSGPLAFQDNRETGNLDESPNYIYGQSFSSSAEDSDSEDSDSEDSDSEDSDSEDSDSEATDSRIEALQQEQKELLEQVDSVTSPDDSLDSFDSDSSNESTEDSDEGSGVRATTQADVEAAFQGLKQIDAARSAELPESPEIPVEAAVDPFEEDFEEEVLLQDTYSPFVAKQNQSSLTVTSQNLAHLSPNDEDDDADQPEAVQTDEEAEDPMTNLPGGFSFPTPAADASFVPVQSVPTESSLASVEFDADSLNSDAVEVGDDSGDHEESIDPELAALTSEFPFEDEPRDSTVTSWSNPEQALNQEAQPFQQSSEVEEPAEFLLMLATQA